MKFEITRTTNRGESPHPDAVELVGWVERRYNMEGRTVYKQFAQNFWLGGRNHLVEGDVWVCEVEREYWEIDIDINSIDELYDFKDLVKFPIILTRSKIIGLDKRIEIYDGYRE